MLSRETLVKAWKWMTKHKRSSKIYRQGTISIRIRWILPQDSRPKETTSTSNIPWKMNSELITINMQGIRLCFQIHRILETPRKSSRISILILTSKMIKKMLKSNKNLEDLGLLKRSKRMVLSKDTWRSRERRRREHHQERVQEKNSSLWIRRIKHSTKPKGTTIQMILPSKIIQKKTTLYKGSNSMEPNLMIKNDS